jgi:tetratricopeptide (TPR) repeat protein
MPMHRLALLLSLTALCGACAWPDEPPMTRLGPESGPNDGRGDPPGEGAAALAAIASDDGLAWNDLTQRARAQIRRGELVEAEETLAQAAMQLASLPAWSTRRRTVFGLQARLATRLAEAEEIERADALANQLLELAAAEPEIGGAALISLANDVIRRRSHADEPITAEEKLRILDIVLTTAEAGPVDRSRLEQAVTIAQQALLADAPDLARRAIERASLDARKLHPGDPHLHASIELLRARIALEQDDLATAQTSGRKAYEDFAETSAPAGERAIGEITLAQALARGGDLEQARTVADEAAARLEPGVEKTASISGYARRTILAGLSEIEELAGNATEAERLLREALAIPAVDFEGDRHLLARLRRDLDALEGSLAEAVSGTPAIGPTETTEATAEAN